MTILDVIEASRARLGDTDSTGWTDKRLLNLVNAGQRDLCRRASIYRRMVYLDLANGRNIYSLPFDCYNVSRIERGGKQLPIYSREDAQSVKIPHEVYAIKSNINRSQLEIFPAPTDISEFDNYIEGTSFADSIVLQDTLGVVSGASEHLVMNSVLGVTVGIHDFTACNDHAAHGELADLGVNTGLDIGKNPLGVLVSLEERPAGVYGFLEAIGDEHTVGTYGLCTHASFGDNYLTVYYEAVPPIINWVTGTLFIEDLWLSAMVHYVVGMARQDDNDEGNYQIGEVELKKYEAEVAKAKKISAKSFNSQVGVVRETIYRRF